MNIYDINDNIHFEQVLGFQFLSDDVLQSKKEILQRKANLINAATLDSISNTEVILHITTDEGVKFVQSKIKAIGTRQVLIERGYALPIHGISKIEIVRAKTILNELKLSS